MPYILQSVLLLLGPVLFAASLYMTLGTVIRAVDGHRSSFVPTRWLTGIFVSGDVFSFLIQSSGAALLVTANSGGSGAGKAQTGQNVIIAGLVIQIAMFGVFIAAILAFNLRFRSSVQAGSAGDVPWQGVLNMLNITSVLVMVRNVFRTVQYGMGQDSYLLTQEWPLYVFDAVLMLGTMTGFGLCHPGQLAHPKQQLSSHQLGLL
jgi:hypothetical protein